MVNVGILGGSGYGGSELLRLLLFHPGAEVKLVTAGEHAGKRVDAVHPNLARLTDLSFSSMPPPEEIRELEGIDGLDCLFLALPHGQAMEIAPAIDSRIKVIDLSGDFRLNDADSFEKFYGRAHTRMSAQGDFVYGLTEVNRARIKSARAVANPGCFATALALGLYPFVASGLASGKIIADLKTGSSGSGARPAANTHHPRRANSFYAYKMFEHQHQPEVEQLLASVNPEWAATGSLVMQTHSLPVVRGIFASIYITTGEPVSRERAGEVLRDLYGNEFFIRLVEGSPDINWVKNSNFVDIGWATGGDTLAVFVALDNLVKGAAGQAIQNMNLMFGLEETAGLVIPGSNP